jgi:predicted phosphodiesterase
MKLPKNSIKILVLSMLTFLFSCNNTFEYSPYTAQIDEDMLATTNENLQAIEDIDIDTDTFKFAFITDTHYHYDNLRTVLDDINKQNDIQFVIIGGDFTQQGLQKEYQLFHEVMENLNSPYLTVIGNHDYLSNGGEVYKQMFGDFNYSFEFNQNKFILFDDVIFESEKTPDFDWLSEQSTNDGRFKQTFVIAHFPPFAAQFDGNIYKLIMQNNDVQVSIHGHVHYYDTYTENNVEYLIAPSLENPTYTILTVYEDSYDIELKEL